MGSAIATTATLPSPFTSFLPPPLVQLGAVMKLGEEEEDEEEGGGVSGKSGLMGDGVRGMEDMAELRGRVLRCWALLQSSSDFDPQSLLPLVEVREEQAIHCIARMHQSRWRLIKSESGCRSSGVVPICHPP